MCLLTDPIDWARVQFVRRVKRLSAIRFNRFSQKKQGFPAKIQPGRHYSAAALALSVFLLVLVDSEPELLLPSDDEEDDSPELDAAPSEPPMIFLLEPVLKSVSYQPSPFNLKAAAEISFFKVSSSHTGHNSSGGSLNFCSFSNRCSQELH